jgi:hypothetical protein
MQGYRANNDGSINFHGTEILVTCGTLIENQDASFSTEKWYTSAILVHALLQSCNLYLSSEPEI